MGFGIILQPLDEIDKLWPTVYGLVLQNLQECDEIALALFRRPRFQHPSQTVQIMGLRQETAGRQGERRVLVAPTRSRPH